MPRSPSIALRDVHDSIIPGNHSRITAVSHPELLRRPWWCTRRRWDSGRARMTQYPYSERPVIPQHHWDRGGNPCSRPSWSPCRGPGGAPGSGRMAGNRPGTIPNNPQVSRYPSWITSKDWKRSESRSVGHTEPWKPRFAALVTLRHHIQVGGNFFVTKSAKLNRFFCPVHRD